MKLSNRNEGVTDVSEAGRNDQKQQPIRDTAVGPYSSEVLPVVIPIPLKHGMGAVAL